MRKILFLIICSVFLISGCGSSGGGGAFFETVEVTAHCETVSPLSSDIIVWRGNTGDPCDYSDSEIWPDDVRVTIRSVFFPVIDLKEASRVRIENVRIDYYPWPKTPSLASRYWDLGEFVDPNNGEVTLSIEVIALDQKDYFLNDPNYFASLIVDNAFFSYDVTLTFSVVEITTDKRLDVSTNTTVQVADYQCTGSGDDRICDDECILP